MAVPTSSDARTWQYWNSSSASSSATSRPMTISGSTRSNASTSSASSSLSSSPTSTRVSQHHACAYPSWPSGPIFHSPSISSTSNSKSRKSSFPSSYVSDEDLYGFDEVPHLREAPAPPRTAEAWSRNTTMPFAAQPVLPPVTAAAAAAVVQEQRRRSSAASNASSTTTARKTKKRAKSSASSSSASSKSRG